MARSPCVATNFKNFLPIKDLKSPNNLKLSPVPAVHTQYRSTLSPFAQCNANKPFASSLSPNNFKFSSPKNLYHQPESHTLSVDSPQRLLFISKVKTTVSSSNLLGRGRFGQVVLAKYKDAQVAVKLIKNVSKKHLINEINSQPLAHPHIISILKIERLDDDVLIFMEPWGSLNLQQLLSTTVRIDWQEVLSYSRQLALALEYCHEKGVLHLDVKPANVMVNSNQWIKLGDFGNSVGIHQLDSFKVPHIALTSITRVIYVLYNIQQRVGTVSYCAPEILKGDIPSTKSDVYSYGITLWQLDHNQTPFSGQSWPTIAYLVVAKEERPEVRGNLTNTETIFAKLFRSCWQSDSQNRPSMTVILSILKELE